MKTCYYSLLIFLLCACKETEKDKIARLVNEWESRELIFPENPIFTKLGRDTIAFDTDDPKRRPNPASSSPICSTDSDWS